MVEWNIRRIKTMKNITNYLTKNMFPFPNPIDGWIGMMEIYDWLFDSLSKGHKIARLQPNDNKTN